MLRFLCFLLVPFHCLFSSVLENSRDLYSEAPIPAWVSSVELPITFEQKDAHLQFLLLDAQKCWPENTNYYHIAVKTFTESGVEAIAQLELDFEPSFQRLIVHEVRIYRDGIWMDKKHSRHELLQLEENLEENLVSGGLTLVYFLEDIRPGDILEYAYSIKGDNPLFTSHHFNRMSLQTGIPIEKISHRLLTHPEHLFRIKTFNTQIEPRVKDLSESIREWVWEVIQPEVSSEEEFEPAWYQSSAFIEVSDYQNWGEVVEDVVPLFSFPEDFESSVPSEMRDKLCSWKGSPLERTLAALRFVQDEVRYLGFEEGIMGFKPHDPRIVFQRRFGDCKDKTFLLCSLLHLMDIESVPVLVDTSQGKSIFETLPSPYAFNHIVLQITIEGIEYWVDSTISFQGGELKNNFFPNYYCGLPLIAGANDLISLPESSIERATEIETEVQILSEDLAELTTVWTAFGAKADDYRHYIQSVGLLNLSEESLHTLQKKHRNASIHFPMAILDDRLNNVFTLTESYFIPLRKRGNKSTLNISSIVIQHFLTTGFNPNRTAPYSLTYPLWVKEHIHITNPLFHWKREEETHDYIGNSIHYHFLSQMEEQNAHFYHELKHLDDSLSSEEIEEYWEAVQEIEDYGSLNFKIQ